MDEVRVQTENNELFSIYDGFTEVTVETRGESI
jgi:hypothetical protein